MEVINVRQYEYVWTPTLKSGHDVLSSFEADAVDNWEKYVWYLQKIFSFNLTS